MPPRIVGLAVRHHIRMCRCGADKGVSPKDGYWSTGQVTQGDLSSDWVTKYGTLAAAAVTPYKRGQQQSAGVVGWFGFYALVLTRLVPSWDHRLKV